MGGMSAAKSGGSLLPGNTSSTFMKRFIFILSFLAITLPMAAGTVKVACVGDSVTYGYGIEDRENDSYPAQLQRMLGDGYEVRNFGHNGATLLRHGHRPYNTLEEYGQALEYKADIVIIHLGLNDTDPRNWPHYAEEFIPDYRTLIEDFRRDWDEILSVYRFVMREGSTDERK